jgi:heptosyltransferase II
MTRVLIVKIGAIGDVVMALAAVEALRARGPCRITWVAGRGVAPLLRQVPGIDEIVSVDDRELLMGGIAAKAGVILSVWRRLLLRRFDLILVAHPDPRYRLISLVARGGTWRSFSLDRPLFPVPGRHHVDEYVRLATGDEGASQPLSRLPTISPPLRDDLAAVLGPPLVVALAPGGAKNLLSDDAQRRWPLPGYRRVAERLLEGGITVAVTGGESDSWVRDAFDGLPVIDLIGRTGLLDLVAVFVACDAVVTHDSGPLHLAGLAGTPAVALFGPTNPAEKVPRHEKTVILWGGEDLPCRPCYDGKFYTPCSTPRCMKEISPEQVYAAVLSVIAPEAAGESRIYQGRMK